jgi:OTU domain-containing protein 3
MQVLAEMDGDVDAAIEYMIADRLTVRADDAEGNPYVDNAYNGKSSNCPDS